VLLLSAAMPVAVFAYPTGLQALQINTIAYQNTAAGVQAFFSNTERRDNPPIKFVNRMSVIFFC